MTKRKYKLKYKIIYDLLMLIFLLPFIPILIFASIFFTSISWEDFLEIFSVNIDIFYDILKKGFVF
ncbi:hypothetical protein [Caminicella sporogenes]|uniref:hypothetical protein n=1 Tax=Caminicella sporogenes TaxID=166485 RepID=UPI002540583B|nr:hypothetical protein [Caminicella sporogenes]WIF95840.1 hypothetical protein QNI18_04300 [Caminicella sporogenes]